MIATIPGWVQVVLWAAGIILGGTICYVIWAWWLIGHGSRPNTSVKPKERSDE